MTLQFTSVKHLEKKRIVVILLYIQADLHGYVNIKFRDPSRYRIIVAPKGKIEGLCRYDVTNTCQQCRLVRKS